MLFRSCGDFERLKPSERIRYCAPQDWGAVAKRRSLADINFRHIRPKQFCNFSIHRKIQQGNIREISNAVKYTLPEMQ